MDSLTTRPMPILVVVFAAILPALCSLLSCGQRPPSESLTATWSQSIRTDAFQETTGVAISNSVLFVSDSKQATIYLLNDDGSAKSEWPKRSDVIGRPTHIHVGRDGRLYVPDLLEDRIWVVGEDSSLDLTLGEHGTGNGQFDSPAGVAVADDGSIYVADFNNHRIQQFDHSGGFVRAWGKKGNHRPGSLNYPTDLAVGPDGNVYVADAYNHRIQVFTPTGKHLRTWGGKGHDAGEFDVAVGIAVDRQGRVYVADQFNHRVQVFTAEGRWLGMWGKTGDQPGEFDRPNDIAIGTNGRVYVADFGNARVQVFMIRERADNDAVSKR